MNATWGLLAVLSAVCGAEAGCSPTSYYKNCWIRRFPGVSIDVEESQRRGAQLLEQYQEETALKCSRSCCLTGNFSCNVAMFLYDATQENVNCFHLHCPSLESCILGRRGNVVLYNVTKGVDPDLLVFGKYFTSNVRVLPLHYGRANVSEPLPSDKRHFIHPPPPVAPPPLTSAAPGKPPATANPAPTTTTTTTTNTTRQSPTRPATVPTSTHASSPTSTPPPTVPLNHAPAPTTSTVSFTPGLTTPSPIANPSTLGRRTPQTTFVSSTAAAAAAQPPTTQGHNATPYQSPTGPPATAAQTGPTEVSERHPNGTKSTLGGGHTAGGEGGQGEGGEDASGGQSPAWHVAARALLVAAGVCVAVLLGCCCSVLLVASWRGQRKRMGRYRTSWRGKRGSMRLLKYVLVRESS